MEKFPPSSFGLKRVFEKVGKWKIFRFVGKTSLTANIRIDQLLEEFPLFANVPIHLILLEKFPLAPFGLKIYKLTGPHKQSFGIFEKVGKWKIFPFSGKIFPSLKFLEENLPIFPNLKFFIFSISSENSHTFRLG